MADFSQHLTTEQLSAFLDHALSDQEQQTAATHLAACELCQQRLNELRLTVQLLHALPQPALPRSFALPLDTTQAEPTVPAATFSLATSSPSRSHLAPVASPTTAKRPQPTPLYLRPLRTLSALAAVVGIVFLLSAIFPSLTTHTMTAASTAHTTNGSASANSNSTGYDDKSLTQQAAMSPHTTPKSPEATQEISTPSAAYQPAQPDTQPVASSPPLIVSLFDLTSSQGRAFVGFLLLLAGLVGLLLLRRSHRLT